MKPMVACSHESHPTASHHIIPTDRTNALTVIGKVSISNQSSIKGWSNKGWSKGWCLLSVIIFVGGFCVVRGIGVRSVGVIGNEPTDRGLRGRPDWRQVISGRVRLHVVRHICILDLCIGRGRPNRRQVVGGRVLTSFVHCIEIVRLVVLTFVRLAYEAARLEGESSAHGERDRRFGEDVARF